MELEILKQILAKMDSIETEFKDFRQEVKGDISELKQDVRYIKMKIENEIERDIRIIAEGHTALNKKLDDLKDLKEIISTMQDDIYILQNVTNENRYDIQRLKMAR